LKTPEQLAFDIINYRRTLAINARDTLLHELRSDEEFRILEPKRDLLEFEVGRLRAFKKDYLSEQSQLKKTKAELKNCLSRLGKTESVFFPHYSCKICNDTGIIDLVNNATGIVEHSNCDCIKREIINVARSEFNAINSDICDFRVLLETLKNTKADELLTGKLRKIYLFLSDYSRNYKELPYNIIVIIGTPGTGKTTAVSVFTNKVMVDGGCPLMITANDLNVRFLKYHIAPFKDKQSIFEPLIEADILIVDDLGIEPKYENVTLPYLRELLDYRFKKPIIFTTNLSRESLSALYDKSIVSRLNDKDRSHFLLLADSDLRGRHGIKQISH
jgi:DNA replication protein DnaC